jgi:hypothetical protein
MSKALSLKIKDAIYGETESILHKIHMARNSYINEVVEFYNKLFKRKMLKAKLVKESKGVASDSMAILKEFELF